MKNKEQINILTPCGLIQASKKTGKVTTSLYTKAGYAFLQLWAAQNTPKTKETYIFMLDTGLLLSRYEGQPSGLPEITWYTDNENIEDFCPGAVEAFRKDSENNPEY